MTTTPGAPEMPSAAASRRGAGNGAPSHDAPAPADRPLPAPPAAHSANPAEPPANPAEQTRIDALEAALGPLDDPRNPLGAAALLAADAAGEPVAGAERVLDTFGLNAEFVPAELGGRLTRMDVLGRLLRPLFRRDASLGFGYGLSCFFAAVPVWTAGSDTQRRLVARLLLGGDRVAVARHEVAHGNDFVRDELTARPAAGGGLTVSGSKTAIANAGRSRGLVVFARTSAAPGGGRSHSVLLLDRADLADGQITDTGRHSTNGMRGAEFGGLAFADCTVPDSAVLGRIGDGYELSLRSSLLIRGLIPSIVLAGVDTALRTVAAFATRRRDDGRSSLDVRHVRDVLTGAFLDLLLIDCLALVATRSLHLLPHQMSVYAASAAYLAPRLAAETMDEMAAVLGEESFAVSGTYGMFQKQLRDLPVTSLGHAGSAGRQVSILPQLPHFARHAWFAEREAPGALFRPHEDLPPLDLPRLSLLSGSDPLAATLVACTTWLESADLTERGREDWRLLRSLAQAFTGELRDLAKAFGEIDPGDRAALASPRNFALADRYTLVLAAAACLGTWREQTSAPTDAFLADPAWAFAVLHRLARRLGLPLPDPAEDRAGGGSRVAACEQRVLAEALDRLHGRRSYDLYGSALA
ncbi:acyl-CoA dehydrogenase [Streptomyces filipinensis]|uniref:Acyl-CoA dehydrogenase n=1 Tax=Streptomyces filipinensis TaxID=66887 RepID=A0A918I8Y9_9ACTN|nr:acyl-CoA dehydrogenase [Streptomyces filipinensis]GGU89508.1 acyl-CoA dehydrogenase [Streptomyces filipinensis]